MLQALGLMCEYVCSLGFSYTLADLLQLQA